jgi:hypothetical protein
MKTLSTPLLLIAMVVLTSFTSKTESKPANTYYAFVVATEWDKRYDEPGNNGYVDLTSDIVSFNCNKSDSSIKYQFIVHYDAQEANDNRSLAFNASTASAWVYNTYDEAVASRREWMATKQNSKHKRTIRNFYVTCK